MPQQSAPKVQADATGSPFAGLDRIDLIERNSKAKDPKKQAVNLDSWMSTLYKKSNFDFCNVYLTLKENSPKNDNGEDELTASSMKEYEHRWPELVPKLMEQGWGLLFFYVGYSIRLDQPFVAPPEVLEPNTRFLNDKNLGKFKKLPTGNFQLDLAKARGTLHGAHLKRAVANLPGEHGGAVAFLDNEGSTNPVPQSLIVYFTALFDELRRPGSGNEPSAIRPGFYTQNDDAEKTLFKEGFEDVFFWRYDDHNPGRSKWLGARAVHDGDRPWEITGGRDKKLHFFNEDFPMAPMALENPSQDSGSQWALPVGCQVILAEEPVNKGGPRIKIPQTGKPLGALRSITDWDFSVSLVRDPRYPEANPRFSLWGDSLIRGDFRKLSKGGSPDPNAPNAITMVLRNAWNAQADLLEESMVEPEAPIVLPTQEDLVTINKSGQIVVSNLKFEKDDKERKNGKWERFKPLSGDVPLRRLRGLTATTGGPQGIQMFYISKDRTIKARRLSDNKWSDPAPVAGGILTHPFSNIKSVFLPGDSVNVFFIDSNEHLNVATWPRNSDPKDWPAKNSRALQESPPKPKALEDPKQKPVAAPGPPRSQILPGTAIAAVTSFDQYMLVFAVGRDFHLQMAVFSSETQKWTTVVSLGEEKEVIFAHSRLGAYSQEPGVVLVAAISQEGDPVVYTIKLAGKKGGSWGKVGNRLKQSVETDPPGWAVNPYSDLEIGFKGRGTEDEDIVLLCAGTMPGKTGLLMKSLRKNTSGKWKVVPTSFSDDVGSG